MDQLLSSLNNASLGGGVKKLDGVLNVYISEVSSPSKLWIQEADSDELDRLGDQMEKFYTYHGSGFSLRPDQVSRGMRIAAFACGRWDRAQVVHFVISTSLVKLYFVDFGTFGYLPLSKCRMLIEEFGKYSKKAIRGALHGIRPLGNTRLWDFDITSDFIDSIRNKIQRIQIVKHHTEENFYEFLLFDDSNITVNEKMVREGRAEVVEDNQFASCLFYPSFTMLENLISYPTYSDRLWLLQKYGINFNDFEEKNIPVTTTMADYDNELNKLLLQPSFSIIKRMVFEIIQ